jgi:tRNA-dihydrouridine synthase
MHSPNSFNFWKDTHHPLMMLAPMEDVTDTSFRELVLRISDPGQLHVMFTEFTSTDGLCHPAGRHRVEERLKVSTSERVLLKKYNVKLVAQIWGNDPEKFHHAVKYITGNFQFDGIDINMGCPVRNVVAQGSCSALIDNESLAGEIIAATRQATHLPLSVKTRLGVKNIDTQRWISFLLKQPIDAIILHGRIQKQMSEGQANWDEIGRAVQMRNELAPHIKIIGNGDVNTLEDAFMKTSQFGTDGVMIGRGIFQNPWLFKPEKEEISTEEKLETLLMHIDLFEKSWGDEKHFLILRRFFKIYANGFDGASRLRTRLMDADSLEEAKIILTAFKQLRNSNAGLLV